MITIDEVLQQAITLLVRAERAEAENRVLKQKLEALEKAVVPGQEPSPR